MPFSQPQPSVHSYHPEAWWMLTPGVKEDLTFQQGARGTDTATSHYAVHISNQGLRDRAFGPKAPDEFRILLLGDSFTFGKGVSFDDTIGQHLERLANAKGAGARITVINGGTEGYGPWQERILLRERGFPLQPDMVILQVFPANDIDNTLGRFDRRLRRYDPWAQQDQKNRRNSGSLTVLAHEWLRRHSGLYNAVARATGDAAPLLSAIGALRIVPPDPNTIAYGNDALYWLEPDRRDWYPELVEGERLMEDDILAIRDDCRRRGIAFYAYTMPVRDTYCDAYWEGWMRMTNEADTYERGKSERILEAFYARETIDRIDVPGAIRNNADPCSLYFEYDGHLTPAGSRVVAESIADHLLAHNVIKESR
jgi:hypothetical protein